MGNSEWKSVTRASPCPICGRDSYCSVRPDGSAVWCSKASGQQPGWRLAHETPKGVIYDLADANAPRPTREQLRGQEKRRERKKQQSLQRAQALWDRSEPIGDRGLAYLRSRSQHLEAAGLRRRDDRIASIRFVDSCELWADGASKGTFPALVCALRHARTGAINAVHRIYLDPAHPSRRLAGPHAKKLLASPGGASVQLGDASAVAGGTLIITEGIETGVACHVATGLPVWACVSTYGLESLQLLVGDAGPSRLIIAADNDAPDHQGRCPGAVAAENARERLSLQVRGANVQVVLPEAPDDVTLDRKAPGGRKSWDWLDALERHGPTAVSAALFRVDPEHVAGVGNVSHSEASGVRGRQVPGDPLGQARAYIDDLWSIGDHPTLRRYREAWYGWDGRRYVELSEEWFRGHMKRWLQGVRVWNAKQSAFVKVGCTRAKVSELEAGVASIVFVGGASADGVESPIWVGPDGRRVEGPLPTESVVAFSDGLLDLRAWCRGERAIIPHTPEWFSTVCLDFALAPNVAPGDDAGAYRCAPHYRRFISHAFGESLEDLDAAAEGKTPQIDLWHEWVGYGMTPDNRAQKILCVQGPPGTGKGTMSRLAFQLWGGIKQIASTSLTDLGGRFGLEPLVGRLNCIIPDAQSPKMDVARIGVERLKNISGCDPVPVDRKTVKAISSITLPCRFSIFMNEQIKLPDDAGALQRRLMWLNTPRPVKKADPTLEDKLAAELPYVAMLALNGEGRRRARGGDFTETPTGVEMAAKFRLLASPIAAFVDECCDLEWEQEVEGGKNPVPYREVKQDVYDVFCAWAEARGHRPHASNTFANALRSVVPSIAEKREKQGDKRPWYWLGLIINPDGHALLEGESGPAPAASLDY